MFAMLAQLYQKYLYNKMLVFTYQEGQKIRNFLSPHRLYRYNWSSYKRTQSQIEFLKKQILRLVDESVNQLKQKEQLLKRLNQIVNFVQSKISLINTDLNIKQTCSVIQSENMDYRQIIEKKYQKIQKGFQKICKFQSSAVIQFIQSFMKYGIKKEDSRLLKIEDTALQYSLKQLIQFIELNFIRVKNNRNLSEFFTELNYRQNIEYIQLKYQALSKQQQTLLLPVMQLWLKYNQKSSLNSNIKRFDYEDPILKKAQRQSLDEYLQQSRKTVLQRDKLQNQIKFVKNYLRSMIDQQYTSQDSLDISKQMRLLLQQLANKKQKQSQWSNHNHQPYLKLRTEQQSKQIAILKDKVQNLTQKNKRLEEKIKIINQQLQNYRTNKFSYSTPKKQSNHEMQYSNETQSTLMKLNKSSRSAMERMQKQLEQKTEIIENQRIEIMRLEYRLRLQKDVQEISKYKKKIESLQKTILSLTAIQQEDHRRFNYN